MFNKDWQLSTFKVTEFKKKTKKYCICIPVINEGEKLRKQLSSMRKYTNLADILILDGGSRDGSNDKSFLRENKVRALLIKTSPGKQSTQLRMGYAYALKEGYKSIITIDGNGKDGVEKIPEFIKLLDEGYDCLQGSRFRKGGKAINTPILRWVGIRLFFSPILSLTAGFWFTDITNGFRAYSSKFLSDPRVKLFRNIFIRYELLFYLPVRAAQLGLRVKEIPVTRGYPKDEVPTKITGLKSHLDLVTTAIKVAFNFYNPD